MLLLFGSSYPASAAASTTPAATVAASNPQRTLQSCHSVCHFNPAARVWESMMLSPPALESNGTAESGCCFGSSSMSCRRQRSSLLRHPEHSGVAVHRESSASSATHVSNGKGCGCSRWHPTMYMRRAAKQLTSNRKKPQRWLLATLKLANDVAPWHDVARGNPTANSIQPTQQHEKQQSVLCAFAIALCSRHTQKVPSQLTAAATPHSLAC